MLTFHATAAGGIMSAPLELVKFPAGEAHINLIDTLDTYVPGLAFWQPESDSLNDELMTLAMYADYAHQQGVAPELFVPYFPAARQDRGVPFGAKVYADAINRMGFSKVTIFDPHSPVICGLIERLHIIDTAPVIKAALGATLAQWDGIIAPDAGAVERAQHIADELKLPLFKATKIRSGRTLSGFACEPLPSTGRFLIVDDICDGGGTFLGLAEVTGLPRTRLGLWVSHGVFSGRAPQLRERFGVIHTTNSHGGATRKDVAALVHDLMAFYPLAVKFN